jgi:tetratricopeptide (TPR) repeat protein
MILQSEAWSIQARAEFALGETDSALASAASSAELLRSTKIPFPTRNHAWEMLGQLGADLFTRGESTASIEFLREAVRELEAAGATETAAQYRIKLAGVYRELGRVQDAWSCLPAGDGLAPTLLQILLVERARLQLASGCPEDAFHDCGVLIPHGQCETAEQAVVVSLHAQACLETGDFTQAATLARQAAGVLGPWGHYEAARCLIVLALAEARAGGEWDRACVDKARDLIASDLLLSPASKSRLLAANDALQKRYAPEAIRA